jgi:hypothetical protein
VAGINLTTLVVPFWNRLRPEQLTNYYFNKEKAVPATVTVAGKFDDEES